MGIGAGFKAIFGTGGDVNLYHDGSNMTMINSTGSMAFYQAVDDGDMKFYCDDGSGGNAEYLRIDGGDEQVKVFKNLIMGVQQIAKDDHINFSITTKLQIDSILEKIGFEEMGKNWRLK